jgi:hypothetical protein
MDFNFVFFVWNVCWATHNNFIHPSQRRNQMRDTIDMARETKMPYDFVTGEPIYLEKLKAFEALVRADEQKAIIDLVAMYGGPVDLEAAIRARGETK